MEGKDATFVPALALVEPGIRLEAMMDMSCECMGCHYKWGSNTKNQICPNCASKHVSVAWKSMRARREEPRMVICSSEERPKWVKADKVVSHKDEIAVVQAWGYEYAPQKVNSTPSDRFEPATYYVIVEHPTGNWLRVWWLM